MKTQQVPNSPYFICYDENGFFCVSKDKDGKEPISAFAPRIFGHRFCADFFHCCLQQAQFC